MLIFFRTYSKTVQQYFCLGYSGTVTRNKLISTINKFGPQYSVVFDVIVNSAGKGWSSIIRFTSTDNNCCNHGDRVPAVFYNSDGFLYITSSVNDIGNYGFNYDIDLKKWYHIEIVQANKNGKVKNIIITISYSEYLLLDLLHYQYQWCCGKECGQH